VDKATKTHRKVEFVHGAHLACAHQVHDAVEESIKALEAGVKPNLVEDGLGGTYFIKDRQGKTIAVFKPKDEEPLAPNNPKVHAGEGQGPGLKEGVMVGEAGLNEYAAFLLDQASPKGLRAGVCPTALVRVANSVFHTAGEDRRSAFRTIKDKVGSFQLFAQHDCTSEDIGPSRFPDDQVHRIAALDIRLCNTDRHSGNILVKENGGAVEALVPIDHGYALPGEIGEATFEWLSWPAAKQPFSAGMRSDILAIDVGATEAMLRKRIPELRAECLRTLRVGTLLLQRGVEAGLTAFDIGMLMVRPEEEEDVPAGSRTSLSASSKGGGPPQPSVLETLVAAQDLASCPQETLNQLLKETCQAVAAKRGEARD
jgi:hypothetical protein